MSRIRDSFKKLRHVWPEYLSNIARSSGGCPDEWLGLVIMGLDEGRDIGLEPTDAAMHAALDLLVGEQREPAFDLVEPGGAGRGEVEVIARVAGEPRFDGWRFVGGVIVEHQMDVEIGLHGLLDLPQKFAEFDRAVALVAAADDPAGGNVQAANNEVVSCRV